ncbi:hypothetical protein ACO0LG_04570 [Undibacterium sp. Ji42W]|uniref:hypothetical protein n=1 Tax=Undibacterium sp. Ji42W TaxID=3413039 RepID=UPI003BF3E0E3
MTERNIQSNWPDHLTESMYFPPIDLANPVGSNKMGFVDMGPKQFEQFCWFLIRKDYLIDDIQYVGAIGTNQDGIDLIARDKLNPSQLIVFECKCWKKFNSTRMREAIDLFLKGEWPKSNPIYILIIAQEDIGNLNKTWQKESRKLQKHGIKSFIWTGIHLAERVQCFPDIVTRFFTAPIAQYICHDWMQKVRFIERLHYAYIHEDPEIRALALQYMNDASTEEASDTEKVNSSKSSVSKKSTKKIEFIERFHKIFSHENEEIRELAEELLRRSLTGEKYIDETLLQTESQNDPKSEEDKEEKIEKIFNNDTNWTIDHPTVYIHCLKPKKRQYPASALIKFRLENAAGVDVTLSQKWLIANMFGAEGSPIDREFRPFIISEFVHESVNHSIIQLRNCRLYPPRDKMKEICNIVDELSNVVSSALLKLENDWDAVDFPFVHQGGTTQVAICTMPKWLWKNILDFANAHDVSAGETEWHIFDQNQWYLKIFTNRFHNEFDVGYHGLFYANENLAGTNYGNSVAILWQPPNSFHDDVPDKRNWMPCLYALQWITQKLLPKVKGWIKAKEIGKPSFLRKNKVDTEFNQWWERNVEIRDLREFPFIRERRYLTIGLVNVIEKLQYSIHPNQRAIYLTTDEESKLHEALILILSFQQGHSSYIASNLGIRSTPDTHMDIINSLRERIEKKEVAMNMFALRYMLSAFLEALNDTDDFLSIGEKEVVFDALTPLMEDVDKRQFLDRHYRWVDD